MSNQYSYIFCPDSITLMNLDTGNNVTVYSDNAKFSEFKSLVASAEFDAAEKLVNEKAVVEAFAVQSSHSPFCIHIDRGQASFSWYPDGDREPLNNVIIDRMINMSHEGLPVQPLINFMGNLLRNPSKQSVDELYLFLESAKLPITEDGCFIAYKIVKADYTDIYTGKFDNSVGRIVQVTRNQVDDNRNNHCSQGLHFCSRGYLSSYGTSNRTTDRCVLVKINPSDVVSIPSDYNNAKGRCWKYEVVGEVPSGWRNTLPNEDYTKASVVNPVGAAFVPVNPVHDYSGNKVDVIPSDLIWDTLHSLNIDYIHSIGEWYDVVGHTIMSVSEVAFETGYDEEVLQDLIDAQN